MQASPLSEILARNVKRLMEKRGLSAAEMGRAAKQLGLKGLSRSRINYLLTYKDDKHRHAALNTVENLGLFFGVEPLSLLRDEESHSARVLHIFSSRRVAEPRGTGAAENGIDPETLELLIDCGLAAKGFEPAAEAVKLAEWIVKTVQQIPASGRQPTRAEVMEMLRAAM
jgi:hypothetical protein